MSKRKDLTGMRFGKLVVIEPTQLRSGTAVVWRCKCDCGNEAWVSVSSLVKGNTKSCGCEQGRPTKDLRNQRFGKLVAIEPTEERRYGSVVWRCKCDCGNEKLASVRTLVAGGTKSCGCGHKKQLKQVGDVCGCEN